MRKKTNIEAKQKGLELVIIRAEGAKPLSWEQAYKIFYLLNKSIQNEPAIINPPLRLQPISYAIHYDNRHKGSTGAIS